MRGVARFVAALVLCAAGIPRAADGTALAAHLQGPLFHAGVNLVEVDVSVLDKKRQPVRGLRPDAFTVLDNGVARPVVAFSAVEVPDADQPLSTPVWASAGGRDVRSNQPADGRLVVLVISDRISSKVGDRYAEPGPGAMDVTAKVARTVIDRLGPNDLASLVYLYRQELSQSLTGDRARLLAALDRFDPVVDADIGWIPDRLRGPLTTGGPSSADIVLTLARLVDSLSTVADRRKTLFFIDDGSDLRGSLRSERDYLYREAERADVNLYCLDPDGLVAPLGGARSDVDPHGPSRDLLVEAAQNTGGEAIVNTNDPGADVDGIFRENQSYYLLGFEPLSAAKGGEAHRLEVKANLPGVEVRARNHYLPGAAGPSAGSVAPTAAEANPFGGPLPATGLPLSILVTPLMDAGHAMPTLAVAVGVREPGLSWARSDTLDVEFRAYAADGHAEGSAREAIRATGRRGADGDREGVILARVDLGVGYHSLRVAVRSKTLNRTGSIFADVDVPDLADAPLSLSGVVLHQADGPAVLGTEALVGLIPAVPTTSRVFSTGDHVRALLWAYQGALNRVRSPIRPVVVAMHLRDAQGSEVASATSALSIAHFAYARRAEATFDLPLDRLSAGKYLAEFDATLDAERAQRAIELEIR